MWKSNLVLLALAGSCLAQGGRPIIITQPGTISGKGTRAFQGVTVTAGPNFSTNVLDFTLTMTVSPITIYTPSWEASGPGTVTFDTPNSTSTVVHVTVNGNYDFIPRVDAGARFKEGALSVAVNVAANTAPTISPMSPVQADEDNVITPVNFTVGDDHTAPGSLTILTVSGNTNVLLNTGITLGGSGAARFLTLVPRPNANGTALVTVSVTDAENLTTQGTVQATWIARNDPPVLGAIGPQAMLEDNGPLVVPFSVTDVDSALSVVTTTGVSTNAALIQASGLVSSGNGSSRTLSITPALHAFGTNTIRVVANDGIDSTSVTFTLAVVRTNYPPVMAPIPDATVQLGNTRNVSFNAQDVEDANLSYSGSSSVPGVMPSGNITFSGSGTNRVATLNPVGVGATTVQITAQDTEGKTASRSFTFTVSAPPNTLPTVIPPANQTIAKNASTGSLTATVNDAETPAANLILSAQSSNPALLAQSGISLGGSGASRTVVLTPVPNQTGTATVVLTVQDSAGGTGTGSFSLTVTNVNQAPTVAAPATATGTEDTPITIAVTVADPDGTTPALTAVSSNPALIPNNPANITIPASGGVRNVVITPAANAFGDSTITWTVSDGSLTANAQTVLTMASSNDRPTISGLVNATSAINTTTVENFTVGDVETPAGTLGVSGTSSNQGLFPNANLIFGGSGANRTISAQPLTGQSGSAVITVVVTDANGGNNSQSFTIVVTPAGGGRTFYVDMNGGSSSNPGTQASPWDWNAILNRATKNLQSGDDIKLLPGTYTIPGNNVLRFSGYDQAGYITIEGFNRVWGPDSGATIINGNNATRGDGCIDGTLGSANRIRFKNIVGFNTALRQTWPSANTDRRNFVYWTARGDVQFVNCWSQDSGNGFGFEDDASIPSGNALFYGNVSTLNGSPGSDDVHHGHNFYVQCKHPTTSVIFQHNVSHNACGQGWQVRAGDQAIELFNTILFGNVFFNNGYAGMDVKNGALAAPSPTRNFLFGGGERATNYVIVSNMTYYALPDGGPSAFLQYPTATTSCNVGNGVYSTGPNMNTNLLAAGNVIWGGEFEWGRWKLAIITNNLVVAGTRTAMIYQDQFTVDSGCPAPWASPFNTGPLGGIVDRNFLYGSTLYNSFRFGNMNQAQWTANTTFGANDLVSSSASPSTNIVVLFPNAYDNKLALLVIYNPSGASSVTVNLGGLLSNGDPYDIYSATSRTARHSSGVYSGSANIPMVSFPLTTMVGYQSGPNLGGMRSPAPFMGVFTVIKNN